MKCGDFRHRSLLRLTCRPRNEQAVASFPAHRTGFPLRLRRCLQRRRSQPPVPPGLNLRLCARLSPNTPSGQMRLSSSLRVTTQSFLLHTAITLFRRRLQPPSGTPVPRLRPGPVAFATTHRRSLDHFAALLLRDLIRLLLALTGLRLRQLQPELSRRFRG